MINMDKIKKFITCHVPVYACNFRCTYCYVGQHQGAYRGGIKPFVTSVENIKNFFSMERLGGSCYFNLCATGETMMHPEIVNLAVELAKEGHYVDIITNGTLSKKIDELISKLPENYKSHVFIKFSFHYLELIRTGKMEEYLNNVKKIKNNNISFTVEMTPSDDLVPYIDEIKEFSIKHFGTLPHVTVARNEDTEDIALLTNYDRDTYKKIWSAFDSELFDFKFNIFNQPRNEFCYAGLWSLYVNLANGDYNQCYCGDLLGNITETNRPINLRPIGKCRMPHCFNGHAFLTYGDIPEMDTPTYAQVRDRVDGQGNHWLREDTNSFFSSKLKDSNEIYTEKMMKKQFCINKIFRVTNKVKCGIKRIQRMVEKYSNQK